MADESVSPDGTRQGKVVSAPILVKRLTPGEKNDNWIKVPASA